MQDNTAKILEKGIKSQGELSVVGERIETFRKEVLLAMEMCKPTQDLERRNLAQALQISGKVLEYLTLNINEAKLAKNKIQEISKVGKVSILEKFIP